MINHTESGFTRWIGRLKEELAKDVWDVYTGGVGVVCLSRLLTGHKDENLKIYNNIWQKPDKK